MFINKLNQLFKPKRVLYYQEASKEELDEFYRSGQHAVLDRYRDAFGTYDDPGVFFLDGVEDPVIGIEYRENDPRIAYPAELKHMLLDSAFYYSVEIDHGMQPNRASLREFFLELSKKDDAHRLCSDLAIAETPRVISVFSRDKKLRFQYEWTITKERAGTIIRDDYESLDKEMLYRMAFFDPITAHYNWNHLVPFLELPLLAGITDYAFVHFDVKEFKVINEVYGHIAANGVLCSIVQAMNESDFVYSSARCHNDNFAMMIKDMSEEETIEKLRAFFDGLSHLKEDPNYRIFFRCGVVPMKRAILSGNRVADAGKMAQQLGNRPNATDIVIYSDQMHDDILWSNYIKAYVDTAIENDEFIVVLQPKFDIRKESIKGAEALIRWNYKKEEMLPPYRFIPFFEKDGTIGKIDDLVLRKVCAALSKWKEEGRPLYPISVNLSRSRLYDKTLVQHLTDVVDAYGVDHALIDFELTESASYDNKEQMLSVLEDLRSRGFPISMDDFGTGYSSLSLLTEMPLDTLKIDKSFVDKIGVEGENEKDLVVIRTIISLARELGFTCLAEGAEEKQQVDMLRALGCEVIQGYYYSRPIPIVEYEKNYL